MTAILSEAKYESRDSSVSTSPRFELTGVTRKLGGAQADTKTILAIPTTIATRWVSRLHTVCVMDASCSYLTRPFWKPARGFDGNGTGAVVREPVIDSALDGVRQVWTQRAWITISWHMAVGRPRAVAAFS